MVNHFDDSSIRSFFIIEAREYINTCQKAIKNLLANPTNPHSLLEIQKTAHTLKGSAGMLRFEYLSKLAYYMEHLMKKVTAKGLNFGHSLHENLKLLIKLMEKMLDNIEAGKESENVKIYEDNQIALESILGEGNLEKVAKEGAPASTKPPKQKKPSSPASQLDEETNGRSEYKQTESYPAIDNERAAKSKKGVKEKSSLADEESITEEKVPAGISGEPEDDSIEITNTEDSWNESATEDTFAGIDTKSYVPKKTDFFVPTTETTSLQDKKAPRKELSFLDLIPDIKEAFILETTDHIRNIDNLLLDWESAPKNQDLTNKLMRSAHSLKGSANTVGFTEMGMIAHRIEDIIEQVKENKLKVEIEIVDIMFEALDVMKLQLRKIEGEEIDAESARDNILLKLEQILSGEYKKKKKAKPKKTTAGAKETTEEESVSIPAIEVKRKTPPQLIIPDVTEEGDQQVQQLITLREIELKTAADKLDKDGSVIKEILDSQVDTSTEAIKYDEEIPSPAIPRPGGLLSIGDTEKQIVRVHINQLDKLMNLVGELVITRSKLDKRINVFKNIGSELDFSRKRLLNVLDEFTEKYEFTILDSLVGIKDEVLEDFSSLEFDKYDDFNILSRSLMEIGSDVAEIINEMKEFLSQFNTEIHDVEETTTRLQEEITQARMVPVGRLFRRFTRTVRDIANRENKSVQLMIMGEDTELDKTVIEEISDPLMHLVRNAVSHGIESPQERSALGKNKQGTILLNAYPQGNVIIVEVEDDGRGLDLDAIKKKAISLSILTPETAETVSQNVLIDFIFAPGFTTIESDSLTDISGRGMGLDVVRENILRLGGAISVQTETNIGTRFIIKLPLTLAITMALIVRSSGFTFAIPLNAVEETIVINAKDIEKIAGQEAIEIRDLKVPFLRLGNLLQLPSRQNGRRFIPAVVLGTTENKVALLVDELLGQEEIVVKRLGNFLEGVRFFSGATISGEGQVVLILDPGTILGAEEYTIATSGMLESTLRERIAPEKVKEEIPEEVAAAPRLLLVDDSISIRKFVGKLLENANYVVDVAVDGLEALQKVEMTKYNLIITDLEMPRMHGYEFISELKRDVRFKAIPIVVLTSRAGEKHKQKALLKGADGYIVKPFNEEILLESIAKLL